MAPIDPLQLLKALAPLLAPNGGMKSADEVVRLSSLMKKFSRKLVSRCVYVNVLRVTPPDVLEAFLAEEGWDTINTWLVDSKKTENHSFLIELLRLFKELPMSVERLKENNSAKVIKSLVKSENNDIKTLATEVVDGWMKLVKGESSSPNSDKGNKVVKKKKKREHKDETKKDNIDQIERRLSTDSIDAKSLSEDKKEEKKFRFETKKPENIKKTEKASEKSSKENSNTELEDVKLPDFLEKEPLAKKPKRDRPKTVKTYQAKFRSTGLEEAMPLPKPVNKKNNVVDKAAALAAKNAVKRIGISLNKDSHPLEKKLKPASLIMQNTDILDKPGIKLIPPKPKPVHIIKESAGFMDALVGEPSLPAKKKRKSSKAPTTPPHAPAPISPTSTTPKLQFYKDTLETQNENENAVEKDGDSNSAHDDNELVSADSEETNDSFKENKNNNSTEKTSNLVLEPDAENSSSQTGEEQKPLPSQTKQKKKVSWAEESQLRQTYYFELDETERVNVNNIKNFGDMKTLERMKERQVVETARRMMMGDKMSEQIQWMPPLLTDLPPPLVERGCNSSQREIQHAREQSILQEIYFSKESVPDNPHEPDPETFEPQEPKIISLEDENNPDSIVDYSMMEPPAPVTTLPTPLSNLMMSLNSKASPPNPYENEMEYNEEMMPDPYYKVPPPVIPHGLLGSAPPGFEPFGKYPPPGHGSPEILSPPPVRMPPNPMNMSEDGDYGDYYENLPPPPPMPHPPMGPRMRLSGPGPMRARGMGPPRGRGMGPPRGPPMRGRGGGGPHMRGRGARVLCRHFALGSCKYAESCMFLHPGINGPLM